MLVFRGMIYKKTPFMFVHSKEEFWVVEYNRDNARTLLHRRGAMQSVII